MNDLGFETESQRIYRGQRRKDFCTKKADTEKATSKTQTAGPLTGTQTTQGRSTGEAGKMGDLRQPPQSVNEYIV